MAKKKAKKKKRAKKTSARKKTRKKATRTKKRVTKKKAKKKKKKATKKKRVAKKRTAKKKTSSRKKKSKKKTGRKTKASKKRKTSSKKKTATKSKTKKRRSSTAKKAATKPKRAALKKRPKQIGKSKEKGATIIGLPKRAEPAQNRLEVGDKAPSFTLMDQMGMPRTLEDYRGQKVVLYFYPKDDTPGCTREACSFRDHLASFDSEGTAILGVSFDDKDSHQKFIDKYGLNFTLLSDTEKEVAKKYGVYVQKNMYGKTYWGIERSTFVINKEGYISEIFRQVKVDGHTEQVLEALRKTA